MTLPSSLHEPTHLRSPQFRPRLVIDQLFVQPAISNYQLRKYTGKDAGEGVRQWYSPTDVRRAKIALHGITDESRSNTLPPVIDIRMAKGGTGKSTVAGNQAAAFAFMGYKVLAIDGDPQASLTNMLGVDSAEDGIRHIGHLMMAAEADKTGKVDFAGAVKSIYPDGMLDLIPADITLTEADAWLMTRVGRDTVFSRLIESNRDFFQQYDVIIIDSAPGTTLLAYNFMAACRTLLAVVWLDRESLKAVNLLMSNVEEINRAIAGRNLDIRIVANGYHPSYKHCREAIATLAASYPGKVNENIIPHYAGFARQQALLTEEAKGPLVEQDPFSPGSKSMFDLARSLLSHYRITLAGWDEGLKIATSEAA